MNTRDRCLLVCMILSAAALSSSMSVILSKYGGGGALFLFIGMAALFTMLGTQFIVGAKD